MAGEVARREAGGPRGAILGRPPASATSSAAGQSYTKLYKVTNISSMDRVETGPDVAPRSLEGSECACRSCRAAWSMYGQTVGAA